MQILMAVNDKVVRFQFWFPIIIFAPFGILSFFTTPKLRIIVILLPLKERAH